MPEWDLKERALSSWERTPNLGLGKGHCGPPSHPSLRSPLDSNLRVEEVLNFHTIFTPALIPLLPVSHPTEEEPNR